MKKAIIILALIGLAIGIKAQTIDTAWHTKRACKVVSHSITVNGFDTTRFTHVAISSVCVFPPLSKIILVYELDGDSELALPIFLPAPIELKGADYAAALSAFSSQPLYFFTYLSTHVDGGITYQ